jgi:hypothetical protein
MKKTIFRTLALTLALLALSTGMAACGGSGPAASSGAASAPAAIENTYNILRATYIEAIGWYQNEIYSLELNNDGTYHLLYNTNRFGAEDYDMRGLRTIAYTGKYTSKASEDGEPAHLDVSLEAPTQIAWDQQGKGFTRVQTLPGNFFINTSAWTDAMTGIYDPANNSKKAADFLAEFGKAMTLTVENPALDPEDTTLTCRIIGVPDMGLLLEAEG